METHKKLPLEYVIREPQVRTKRSPVIFMLHGYGSNEEDLFSFADELPKEYTIISLRAPYNLTSFGYAWYMINFDEDQAYWSDNEQAIESRELIMRCIDEACKVYDLDTRNINLLGFSQGSILSMAIAISYPKKIRRVIALSGYLNEDILKDGYKKENHSATHFYVSHGTSDQVIPVEWDRKTPEFLKSIGAKCTYEEFPIGHGVSPQNFYSFREWLSKY
ncbi:Carboxylesterase 2 [Capnocytophaga ochracea]|nr:Carboxylesterase 2 [Capnocytophaga ochracea]SQA93893.1 Carboxylesterase 2 [Capnocytophaga ochracea]